MMPEKNQEANEKNRNALDSAVFKAQPTREKETSAERNEFEVAKPCDQII